MEAAVTPRWYLTGTAITGIVYTLSWIVGLSVVSGVLLLVFVTGTGTALGRLVR
jgi:hypothetical protein